jgi:hypothetical protein
MVRSLRALSRCLILFLPMALFAVSGAWTADPAATAKNAEEEKSENADPKEDGMDDAGTEDKQDGAAEGTKEKKTLEDARKALADARKKLTEAKKKNAEAKKAAEEAIGELSEATKEYTEAMKKFASLRKTFPNAALEAARKASEEQRRAEQERLKNDPKWQPLCEPAEVIKIGDKKKAPAIHSFCLNEDGNLLVCTGGSKTVFDPETRKSELVNEPTGIHVLDSQGKPIAVWPTKFEPQAICRAKSGTIIVGGEGILLKLDREGKELARAEAPIMTELPPLVDEKDLAPETEAEKKAREEKVAELEKNLQPIQKEYEAILAEMRKNLKSKDEESKKILEEKIKEPQANFLARLQELNEARQTPQMKAAQERAARKHKLTINAIAVSGDDVFIACPMTKTNGYAVWRTDLNFANPKKIIVDLSGCCLQMDIKAKDGEVWVAHNGRHKVERYDRDGKKLFDFGKPDRLDAAGFGGCCEPKNICFDPNGNLLACESGPPACIKRFSVDGNFLGVLAIAPWTTSCDRATADATPDGSRYYFLHSQENTIQVFTPKKAEEKK